MLYQKWWVGHLEQEPVGLRSLSFEEKMIFALNFEGLLCYQLLAFAKVFEIAYKKAHHKKDQSM